MQEVFIRYSNKGEAGRDYRTSQYSRDEEGESNWRPHSLHILLLGVLGDRGALAVGFELVLNNLAICIVFDAERVVQHPSDVIISKHRQQKKNIIWLCMHHNIYSII